jgi:hypothetical protein
MPISIAPITRRTFPPDGCAVVAAGRVVPLWAKVGNGGGNKNRCSHLGQRKRLPGGGVAGNFNPAAQAGQTIRVMLSPSPERRTPFLAGSCISSYLMRKLRLESLAGWKK